MKNLDESDDETTTNEHASSLFALLSRTPIEGSDPF